MDTQPQVRDSEIIPRLDSAKGEMRAASGEDWVLISGEALRRVYESEVSILGTGAFVIWYNAGKTVGRTEGSKFAELISEVGVDQLANELSKTYSKLGWGQIQVGNVDLINSEIKIVMRNSPMVRGIADKEPRCWYVRGFMEGMVSTILGVEANAFEVACEAVNRHHCEFKVNWKMPTQ